MPFAMFHANGNDEGLSPDFLSEFLLAISYEVNWQIFASYLASDRFTLSLFSPENSPFPILFGLVFFSGPFHSYLGFLDRLTNKYEISQSIVQIMDSYFEMLCNIFWFS